jgi:16S rRNA (guanine527-N7)-methyltransferase
VSSRDIASRVARRAARAGLSPAPELLEPLTEYLALLGRWNRKINLTALQVNPVDDEAVDRLIVEPLLAARRVGSQDKIVLDIGSGGGSPAFPFRLACPAIQMVLVESKVRKAAFLREVVRTLALDDIEVANCRLEELLARSDLTEAVDILTMRAVRLDSKITKTMLAMLRTGGRLFRFTSGEQRDDYRFPFVHQATERLPTTRDSSLVICEKRGD